jgi:hypothetical protein
MQSTQYLPSASDQLHSKQAVFIVLQMNGYCPTIEYMEMFPHNPPNGPARDVDLIFRWGCLYEFFSIIALMRILYFENFSIMASGRRRPEDGFK